MKGAGLTSADLRHAQQLHALSDDLLKERRPNDARAMPRNAPSFEGMADDR
jgi:hypothetical protein